jgi:hypothetical protein
MQYTPPAAGLLSGFERGIDLYRKLFELPQIEQEERAYRARQRQREEIEFQNRQEDRAIQRERGIRQEEAARIKSQLDIITSEQESLAQQAAALRSQYGSEIPTEAKTKLGAAFRALQAKREKLLSDAEGLWKRVHETGTGALQRLNAGDTSVGNKDLISAVAITGYDPRLLTQPDQTLPSPLQKAVMDVHDAMESGNFEKAADAANVILSPELRKGVGSPGADGTTITKKEIIGFVPSPDGGKVSPVLRVYTVGNPQGYIAPVTKNRTADPNDEPVFLSMEDLLDRAGKAKQLADVFSTPVMQQKLQDGMKKGADDIDVALEYFGRIPLPKNIGGIYGRTQVDRIDAGDRVIRVVRDRQTGEILDQQEIPKGVSPDTAARTSATVTAAGIRAGSAERVAQTRQAGRESPRTGAGGAPPKLTDRNIESLVENAASKIGLFKDKGTWYKLEERNGRQVRVEPNQNDLQTINQIRAGIVSYAKGGTKGTEQTRVYTSPSELPPPEQRAVGQPFNLNGKLRLWMGSGWLPLD